LSQDLAAMPATAFEIVNVNTLKLTVTVNESQVVNLKKKEHQSRLPLVFIQVKNLMEKSYSSLQKQTVV
jgi:hypothetical protein